jgi:hypothetical protein
VRALRWDGARRALARDVPDPAGGLERPGLPCASPTSAAPISRSPAAGRVAVAPLIGAVYPLEDGIAALARAATPGTFKITLAPAA